MRLAAILLLVLAALPLRAETLSFGLFGDTPYTHWERQHLPELLAEMGQAQIAFAIHVGDIKSGSTECSDATLRDIRDAFEQSAVPLVYVPGDNEWTDCHRRSNGGYDPLERLARLRELFFRDQFSLGRRKLRLERQSDDPAFVAYRENARWEAAGIQFVTLNIPGSENNFHGNRGSDGPVAEFLERSVANRVWLAAAFASAREHKLAGILIAIQGNPGLHAAAAGRPDPGYAEFIEQLRSETRRFSGQVVLVHGDTHHQRVDQPLTTPKTGDTLANFTRVEVHGSPVFGWTEATVDAADPRLFRFSPKVFRPRQGHGQ